MASTTYGTSWNFFRSSARVTTAHLMSYEIGYVHMPTKNQIVDGIAYVIHKYIFMQRINKLIINTIKFSSSVDSHNYPLVLLKEIEL